MESGNFWNFLKKRPPDLRFDFKLSSDYLRFSSFYWEFNGIGLKSKRLPFKILRNIKGKPVLSHMINRIKISKYINKIIVCTSKNKQDDKIEKLCDEEKVNCYRGHPEDVLLRLYEASKKFKLNYIINITADCPLVEPYYIDQICKVYKKKNFDLIRAFDLPHGSFCYGIKVHALKKIINIKSSSNTEVWEKYFTDTGLFKIHDLKIKNKIHIRPGLRMTIFKKNI